jgi:hypothetical protein
VRIHGALQTPEWGNWPFQYTPHRAKWVWRHAVLRDTHVLVTHGLAPGHDDGEAPAVGCVELLNEVRRVRPRLHVCEHVHKAKGVEVVDWNSVQGCYDGSGHGEGGVVMLPRMVAAWVWEWVRCVFGGRRRGRGWFVNAAMREGEVEGKEDGTVGEI